MESISLNGKTYLTNSLIDFVELKDDGGYEAHEQCTERQRDRNSSQRHKADTPRKFVGVRMYRLRIPIHYRFRHQNYNFCQNVTNQSINQSINQFI